MKKLLYTLTLSILMMTVTLTGCSNGKTEGGGNRVEGGGNVDDGNGGVDGNGDDGIGIPEGEGGDDAQPQGSNAKGRYVEQEVELPLPKGVTQQAVVGIAAIEGGVEYYTVDYEGGKPRYFRHAVRDNGDVSTQSEAWLVDNASNNSNGFLVVRSGDKLYAYENTASGDSQIIVSEDDGKSASKLTGNGLSAVDAISQMGVLGDGRIVIAGNGKNTIYVLDAKGNLSEELDVNGDVPSSCFAAYGNQVAVSVANRRRHSSL